MKGNPIQIALRLHKEGYRPVEVDIDATGSHKAFCAWRAEGDHKWLTEQQFRLLENLFYDKVRNKT